MSSTFRTSLSLSGTTVLEGFFVCSRYMKRVSVGSLNSRKEVLIEASVHHTGVATMRNLLLVALTLIACACTPITAFYGDPKVPEGPSGCEAICTAWNMELVGMVALGEYSDGCICQKKGSEVSLQDVGQVVILSSLGVSGAVVGAEMDARKRREDMAAAMAICGSCALFE